LDIRREGSISFRPAHSPSVCEFDADRLPHIPPIRRLNALSTTIPDYMMADRYWRGLILLFSQCPKLKMVFTTEYIDVGAGVLHVTKLKKVSAPWSQSEKFMLNLALHLYNERNKVNLSDMDYLDDTNLQLALKAIQLRFA
jgi:hypothetical protein